MKTKNQIIGTGILLFAFIGITSASLVDDYDPITVINTLVCSLFAVIWGVAGGIAALVIAISGLKWIMSQEDPGSRKAQTENIKHAVVGLLIIMVASAVVTKVTSGNWYFGACLPSGIPVFGTAGGGGDTGGAQYGGIRGVVKYRNGAPYDGSFNVEAYIGGTKFGEGGHQEDNGKYTLIKLNPGTYNLRVYVGGDTARNLNGYIDSGAPTNTQVTAGQFVTVDITTASSQFAPGTVTVDGCQNGCETLPHGYAASACLPVCSGSTPNPHSPGNTACSSKWGNGAQPPNVNYGLNLCCCGYITTPT